MRRSILFYAAYTFVSTALLLLSLETAGRLWIHTRFGSPGKTYGLWTYDPKLGAAHRPNGYNTHTTLNNLGFRNSEDVFEPKPSNGLRIIAFGGSTTFGYNLADGETYTEALEERLRGLPGHERSQVLNAGRICYSAGHNLILMKRLVPELKPDYVILYEGINEMANASILTQVDGIPLESLGQRWGVLGQGFDQNRWLKRNSVLVRFFDYEIKTRISESRKQAPEASLPESMTQIHPWTLENYRFLLGEMLDFLLQQGTVPILIRYATAKDPRMKIFSDLSSEIAHSKGVVVHDMWADFKKQEKPLAEYFIYTGAHVTPEGARILGRGLYRTILEHRRSSGS